MKKIKTSNDLQELVRLSNSKKLTSNERTLLVALALKQKDPVWAYASMFEKSLSSKQQTELAKSLIKKREYDLMLVLLGNKLLNSRLIDLLINELIKSNKWVYSHMILSNKKVKLSNKQRSGLEKIKLRGPVPIKK